MQVHPLPLSCKSTPYHSHAKSTPYHSHASSPLTTFMQVHPLPLSCQIHPLPLSCKPTPYHSHASPPLSTLMQVHPLPTLMQVCPLPLSCFSCLDLLLLEPTVQQNKEKKGTMMEMDIISTTNIPRAGRYMISSERGKEKNSVYNIIHVYVKLKVWIWTNHGLSTRLTRLTMHPGNPWIVNQTNQTNHASRQSMDCQPD